MPHLRSSGIQIPENLLTPLRPALPGPLAEKRALRRSLLRWYSANQRDLPWRKTGDPYKIMVAEFMLQQTRIETVLPYYRRFLRAFPSLSRLARASRERVLKLWAGLGYYARARNLHAAAEILVKDWSGKIPAAREALLALPGFGPYTSGAVASIAFNQRAAALDGNAKRVLSRLFGLKEVLPSLLKKELEYLAEELVPEGRAGDFNQALMDLGATVCLPVRPGCSSCPLGAFCRFEAGRARPARRGKKRRRAEVWLVALIENRGRYFLHRRESGGLLAGLWQFPALVLSPDDPLLLPEKGQPEEEPLREKIRERFGGGLQFQKSFPPVRHEFTHIRASLIPFLFFLPGGGNFPSGNACPPGRWIPLSALSRYPVSRAMMKVADLLLATPSGKEPPGRKESSSRREGFRPWPGAGADGGAKGKRPRRRPGSPQK
jgi:A/G-specific adenine glycosylase